MSEQLELVQGKSWWQRPLTLSAPQVVGAIIVVSSLSFFSGTYIGTGSLFASSQPIYDTRAPENVDLAPLFKTWALINEHFMPATSTATTSPEDKLWGAIQGLAASYGDEYTVFMPPVAKQIFDTQVAGDFSGVGMEIGLRGGFLTVIAPIKDTPAYRAGIKSGDIILRIDDVSTQGMSVETAVSKIRGPKGTAVTLEVVRVDRDNGKPFSVSVVRDTIELPTVDYALREDGIFAIQVYMFNGQAPRKFAEALLAFEQSGSQKLVIDLRNNPGGYLEAAVDMASSFIDAGAVIVTQASRSGTDDQVYRSSGFGTGFQNTEIVVLLNGGSASASEIFAGALRDHNRATLIGTQSFGKGSVQQVYEVTEDTQVKITVARWLTPKGISISHEGLTPDIVVEIPEDTPEGADPILDRAVEYLNTGR